MFTQMETAGLSDLHCYQDTDTGLKAIIAIHSTALGPAIGGCRFIHYDNEFDALQDALRLAQGMSYKAALAGLPHGGGKSVIIRPAGTFDRTALMQAFGRCIEQLKGRYITAMDSGTLTTDMDAIATQTRWASCTSAAGDPSPYTALGVLESIKASVNFLYNKSDLEGVRVAIQGLGHVGMALASHLHLEGAHLTVTDLNPELMRIAAAEYQATGVIPEAIYSADVDIFCPCGLGGILNPATIPTLKAAIVAGSANNQLLTPNDGELLAQRDILYLPDYVINSGGLIFVALEHAGEDSNVIHHKVMNIGNTVTQLLTASAQQQLPPFQIADQHAIDLIAKARRST